MIPNGYNTAPNTQYFQAIAAGVGSVGTTYYVDCNSGNDANDGSSWENAFKTLAPAIAASHARIAADSTGWASRNRIFIKGDSFEENLTAFPQKTDIIGVGSCDFIPKAKIIGYHKPATAVMGCRWFNVAFQYFGAKPIVDLITGNHGAAFVGCDFIGDSTTTKCVLSTNNADIRIEGCQLYGNGTTIPAIGIEIAGTTHNVNAKIVGNFIHAAVGISVAANGKTSGGLIADNYIRSTGLAIDENSDLMLVVNNRWVSSAGNGSADTCDLELVNCVGNILTTANGTCYAYPGITNPTA